MREYERPIVITTDGLSEGVFAASGERNYSLKQTNAWDGNKQYDITLTNTSDKKVDSVSVTVKVKGKVNSIGGNVTGVVNGNTATVSCNNYGNGFEAGKSATFYMAVTGEGDFSLE